MKGAKYLLQHQLDVEIYAHSKDVPLINQDPKLLQYQEMGRGHPQPTEVIPSPDRIDTHHFHLDIDETLGHTPAHITVADMEKGWCFTGDLFVTEKPKAFRPSALE